ncbi:MAG: hypothetical protein JSW68_11450 [Burkholderiales bacterium]|nr:MAG: hypothetical protein JSW68_11450 [Burkholderiales bacterium]
MIEQAERWLKELFAPWVQGLGLRVASVRPGEAVLVLPFEPKPCRVGGVVCWQALTAAADASVVIAISAQLGEGRPTSTVSPNITCMPAIADTGARITARCSGRRGGLTGRKCAASVFTSWLIRSGRHRRDAGLRAQRRRRRP